MIYRAIYAGNLNAWIVGDWNISVRRKYACSFPLRTRVASHEAFRLIRCPPIADKACRCFAKAFLSISPLAFIHNINSSTWSRHTVPYLYLHDLFNLFRTIDRFTIRLFSIPLIIYKIVETQIIFAEGKSIPNWSDVIIIHQTLATAHLLAQFMYNETLFFFIKIYLT